jgi:hypothetical protein
MALIGGLAAACSSGANPTDYQSAVEAGGGGGEGDSASIEEAGMDAAPAVPEDAGLTATGDAGEAAAPHPHEEAGVTSRTCNPALPAVTSSTEYLCDPGGGGCDSCSDCTLAMNGAAKMQVQSCGVSCIGQSDSCVTTCLSGKSPTLSTSCQSCMVGLFDCTTKYCAGPCVTGTAAQCTACLKSSPTTGPTSCDEVFLHCAGLTHNPSYSGG